MPPTSFKLNNGHSIPALGLGTWQSPPGEVTRAVLHALKSGYRHIDCAFMYQNENEVGAAFKEAFSTGVCRREDIWVTTKLWCTYHSRVQEALQLSLDRLGLEYVDLYLMHWPVPMNPNGNHPLIPKHPDGSRDLDKNWSHVDTWKELEKLPSTGKARSIGVSNYSKKYLEELLPQCKIVPAVNQIENHPYLLQQEVVDHCRQNGIQVTAYSPFGSSGSPLFNEPAVTSIAKAHNVTPGCILLSFGLARNIVEIPKSVTPSRIEENMHVVDLSAEEVKSLESIQGEKGAKRYVYPDFGIDFGFPDKAKGGPFIKVQA